MLPATLFPLVVYHTRDDVGHLLYLRGRYALFAPSTPQLSHAATLAAQSRADERAHGVPVLVYHGIGRGTTDTGDGRFVVSRERFAEQLQSLRAAGFEAITTRQLAAYLRSGDIQALPDKPVLITFDDGRADAMLQADRIMRDTGMRATMFVIGERAESGGLIYSGWDDLGEYVSSGRWEIGNHTYDLHAEHDLDGIRLSSLVNRRSDEDVSDYRGRVEDDLGRNQKELLGHLGVQPLAFAYPFGDIGLHARPGVRGALLETLAEHFEIAFHQYEEGGWRHALPGDDLLGISRLTVENWTGLELLERLDAAAALADAVYEERALGYEFSPAELAKAAARVSCAPARRGVVERRKDISTRELVALTFDDGPSVYTPQILDVLRANRAVATFFVLGSQIDGRERLLQRMLMEGSEIGNHGMAPPEAGSAPTQSLREDVEEAARGIAGAVPLEPCLLRPPRPGDTRRALPVAREHDLTLVSWSHDARDLSEAAPEEIAERVLNRLKPGTIVRLHDGGGARWRTVQALPIILAELEGRGFQTVTVSELLAAEPARGHAVKGVR